MAFFLPSLKKSGHLNTIHMTICNVGSRKSETEDDYGSQGWDIFAPNLTIYGFDADPEACEAANADIEARQVPWNEIHLPIAFAKTSGIRTLHVTKNPMCSSLYQPNQAFLSRFLRLPELVSLDFTLDIETTTLDAFCQSEAIQDIDFLQIDIQGAELQVLEGAMELLERSVLAIQTEVEFSPLYVNQPLFADVDRFLQQQGFSLFDFSSIEREPRSSIHSTIHPGQLLRADLIYCRDLIQPEKNFQFKTPEQLFKLACIADALELTDYALELLEFLTLNYSTNPIYNFADIILASICQLPELVQVGLESFPTINRLKDYLSEAALEFLETSKRHPPILYASSIDAFNTQLYQRHNQRRLEHLASLGLELAGTTVLEVGAGIGDHTSFFLDRGCQVVATEGRLENFEILQQRYPQLEVKQLDLDHPDGPLNQMFDVVYCYGLLYHLQKPAEAIAFMADHCRGLLLLETAVSPGEDDSLNPRLEAAESRTQSISGHGCRPTRKWIYHQLKQHFAFVYLPLTQPNHEEFPIDWSVDLTQNPYTRSVFIASRHPLNNPLLAEDLPTHQRRH